MVDVGELFVTLVDNSFNKEFLLWNDVEEYSCESCSRSSLANILENIGDELLSIERKLNEVKSKVGHRIAKRGKERWHSHTAFTHPLKELPREVVKKANVWSVKKTLYTQAYCKFAEILAYYPELTMTDDRKCPFRSLHLCEAPGAFICALADRLSSSAMKQICWEWRMNTLNPYHEWNDAESMLTNDSLIFFNLDRMCFGKRDTGNILDWSDEELLDEFALITADGSVDCTASPIDQENRVFALLAQEVRVALRHLRLGGSFVMKVFTWFRPTTIEQVLLPLCDAFGRVVCRKPAASKPGNSEIYLICTDYNGGKNSENIRKCVRLRQRILDAARFFADHQTRFMEFNLSTFEALSKTSLMALQIHKWTAVERALHLMEFNRFCSRNQNLFNVNFEDNRACFNELRTLDTDLSIPIAIHFPETKGPMLGMSFSEDQRYFRSVVKNFNVHDRNTSFVVTVPQDYFKQTESGMIRNSLFCDEKDSSILEDLCTFSNTLDDADMGHIFQMDKNTILTNCWQLTRDNWLEFLKKVNRSSRSLEGVILKVRLNTVILSRFSACVVFALAGFFDQMEMLADEIRFTVPAERNGDAEILSNFLDGIKKRCEENGESVLQFIPLVCLANEQLRDILLSYNNEKIKMLKQHILSR